MEGCSSNILQKMGEAEAALNSINDEFSKLRSTETQGFIYRVVEPLRSVNSKGYEPDILAIGPYHHGKEKYKMMEEHKLQYLKSILERRGETTAERYISVVSELEEKARSCYAEPVNLNKADFIKMLVLDGCFIIELALKVYNQNYRYSNDPIYRVNLILSVLTRDLIMFENQIPFFILRKLFGLIEGRPNQYDRLINLLLSFCSDLFPDYNYFEPKNRSLPNDVKHLLDLIYRSWTPESFDGAVDINSAEYPEVNSDSKYIPSAAELKDANVKFKKRETCDSLFEVKFENGTLLIPPLIIHDETELVLRNLLAHEQYFPSDGHKLVGAYLDFMDLLINSSKDVDVLTNCGIIVNSVGDKEVIVSMFNKLMSVAITYRKHPYGKTFKDINTYRSKRWNRWMAILNRDYFSNPWGILSIVAAFLLLILTIIQAVCSILQVV